MPFDRPISLEKHRIKFKKNQRSFWLAVYQITLNFSVTEIQLGNQAADIIHTVNIEIMKTGEKTEKFIRIHLSISVTLFFSTRIFPTKWNIPVRHLGACKFFYIQHFFFFRRSRHCYIFRCAPSICYILSSVSFRAFLSSLELVERKKKRNSFVFFLTHFERRWKVR